MHDILSRLSTLSSPRYIWVDSICINQSDPAEKAHQIKLMRHIYSRASRVLACLGESRDAGHAAAILNMLVVGRMKFGVAATARFMLGLWQNRRFNLAFESHLRGFLELLDHRWFGRVWVVQEVVFARQLTLHQRNITWIWEYFLEGAWMLIDPTIPQIASMCQSSMEYGMMRRLPYGLSHGLVMAETRDKYQSGGREPLYVILQRFTAFEATNPLDKVFALLGFIDGDLDHLSNYDLSIEELLTRIAEYLVDRGDLVHVLHLAGTGYRVEANEGRMPPRVPSWVADWSSSRAPRTLAHASYSPRQQYRAAVTRLQRIHILPSDRSCLSVVGHVVDRVRHLGRPSRAPTVVGGQFSVLEETFFNLEWLAEARAIADQFAASVASDRRDIEERLWRTIMGDRSQAVRPMPARLIPVFRSFLGQIARIRDTALLGEPIQQANLPQLETRMAQHPELWEGLVRALHTDEFWELSTCQILIGDPLYPRCFCVTDQGRMALLPRNARPDDIVAVVHGSQVPFLIRPNTESGPGKLRFELVGECYVHGLMDGEALQLGLPDTELILV